MSSIDLGRHDFIEEIEGPRTYRVKTGRRYLHGLEDGEVRYWSDHHTIMINEATGQVMIDGAYGTFAYCWPSQNRGAGRSLHGFLHGLSFDYFMSKASTKPYMVADIEGTYQEMVSTILSERRKGYLEKEHARRLWDALEDLSPSMQEEDFVSALYEDPVLYSHYCDGGPSINTKEHQGLRNFWDEVWSLFRDQILAPHAERDRVAREAAKAA